MIGFPQAFPSATWEREKGGAAGFSLRLHRRDACATKDFTQ